MENVLFLHCDCPDPFGFYDRMRETNPVYRDEGNRIWAVYSYSGCRAILDSSRLAVPEFGADGLAGLNDEALKMSGRLVRVSNGSRHEIARLVAIRLAEGLHAESVKPILDQLLDGSKSAFQVDWVDAVCRKIPVLVLAQHFQFTPEDREILLEGVNGLAQLMAPVKTPGQVKAINRIAGQLYPVAEKQVIRSVRFQEAISGLENSHGLDRQEGVALFTSNLLGMFIQAFDGIRGLLTNALIQWIRYPGKRPGGSGNREELVNFVRETLRFDPPVHHTRRIAQAEILLDSFRIAPGDSVLVVLASANRDPEHFPNPGAFDLQRPQNRDHLDFGSGSHHCIADQFATALTAETLSWLVSRYARIYMPDQKIQYEPKSNVRLPVHLQIECSTSNPKP